MSDWNGEERRKTVELTERQIEEIAQRAAEVALNNVYTAVGRSVVSKFLWLCGFLGAALAAWATAHGYIWPKG